MFKDQRKNPKEKISEEENPSIGQDIVMLGKKRKAKKRLPSNIMEESNETYTETKDTSADKLPNKLGRENQGNNKIYNPINKKFSRNKRRRLNQIFAMFRKRKIEREKQKNEEEEEEEKRKEKYDEEKKEKKIKQKKKDIENDKEREKTK